MGKFYSRGFVIRIEFAVEDPGTQDMKELLQAHLNFCREVTPAQHSFALEIDKFREPGITLFGAREDGVLLGVGALKDLGNGEAELKSMRTLKAARGMGIATAMVAHLLAYAKAEGFERVNLETGSHPPYESARKLYSSLGFLPSPPFGEYIPSGFNTFMTFELI